MKAREEDLAEHLHKWHLNIDDNTHKSTIRCRSLTNNTDSECIVID
jgi:hypothetical protein